MFCIELNVGTVDAPVWSKIPVVEGEDRMVYGLRSEAEAVMLEKYPDLVELDLAESDPKRVRVVEAEEG